MRIFHLGLMVAPPPNDSARKAFMANCTDYMELSTGAKDVNQEAVRIAREFRPDIIFMQIQSPNIIHIETVKAMKETGAWVCNWNGDIRDETPAWMITMAPYIDKTLFSNMRDVRNVVNGRYLEIGYDPEIYKPDGEIGNCREISFFGNNYGGDKFPLSRLRIEMNTMLHKHFGDKYGVYGNSWFNVAGNYNHSQAEESKAYRATKIAINLSHYDEDSYSSDRIYRILGSGAFCLCKAYPNMPFIDHVHVRTWNSLYDLMVLLRYYLDDHKEERDLIAKQGNEFVKANYTFDEMVKNLIYIYESK